MKKHRTVQEQVNLSEDELARLVASARYDSLAAFLVALGKHLGNDGLKDEGRKRKKLARELYLTSAKLQEAAGACAAAWKICEPFEQLEV